MTSSVQLFLDPESSTGNEKNTELVELLAECNENVIAIIQLLNKVKIDTETMRSTSYEESQETTMRDERAIQFQTKFLDATNAVLNAQTKYKTDIENLIKAEVHRINDDISDEDIDAALLDTNRTINSEYTIRSGRAALVRPTLYGSSTADIIKGAVLSYPDLPVLARSLSELQHAFYYYVLMPLSSSTQPIQAIGTRPVSDNEATEIELLQNGRITIMRQRRNRAMFGFFLVGGLIAYLFISRRIFIQ